MKKFAAKITIPALLLLPVIVIAQKLPNKQEVSLRAPGIIKIDGKATEWNNKYQAANKATGINYTLYNDDEKLYLLVQTSDPTVITRIMGRGITLSIQKSGKTDDKNSISITFPVMESTPYFNTRVRKGQIPDTTAKTADSIMIRNNTLLTQNAKSIKVKGIAGLDTLISIYNSDGIKAAGAFDSKQAYTYELSVELKQLGISVRGTPKFAYHIIVNGTKPMGEMTIISTNGTAPGVAENIMAGMNARLAQLSAPTDFWGEYTLMKE
jgi:hypothetical protein